MFMENMVYHALTFYTLGQLDLVKIQILHELLSINKKRVVSFTSDTS